VAVLLPLAAAAVREEGKDSGRGLDPVNKMGRPGGRLGGVAGSRARAHKAD